MYTNLDKNRIQNMLKNSEIIQSIKKNLLFISIRFFRNNGSPAFGVMFVQMLRCALVKSARKEN